MQQISRDKFDRFCPPPPNLRLASLIDRGFAIPGPLARRSRLRFGSCPLPRAFAPRFLPTPPHGDALALRDHFSSISMGRGLTPPSCRSCSAYQKKAPRPRRSACSTPFSGLLLFVTYLRQCPRGRLSSRTLQHLFFPVHQRIDVIRRQLKPVSMRNRIRRARLHAISAKNASRIINVVDLRVPFSRRNSARFRILRRFNVNAI